MEGSISVGHVYTNRNDNSRVRVCNIEVSDTATHIITRNMSTGRAGVRPVADFKSEISAGVLRLTSI